MKRSRNCEYFVVRKRVIKETHPSYRPEVSWKIRLRFYISESSSSTKNYFKII